LKNEEPSKLNAIHEQKSEISHAVADEKINNKKKYRSKTVEELIINGEVAIRNEPAVRSPDIQSNNWVRSYSKKQHIDKNGLKKEESGGRFSFRQQSSINQAEEDFANLQSIDHSVIRNQQ